MTIDKLKRVMWRIRSRAGNRERITKQELERAIMIECGIYPMTYYNNLRALVKLGWIKKHKRKFDLTGADLTEDY